MAGYRSGQFVQDVEAVLVRDCDILVPAARESVIHGRNAERVAAKVIAGAANGPVTFEADRLLEAKGVVIIPDLFAYAGGVTVRYFESVTNHAPLPFGFMARRQRQLESAALTQSLERVLNTKFP